MMSIYLARLKQIENTKNVSNPTNTLLTKVTKPSFGSFGGSFQGAIEKNNSDDSNLVEAVRRRKTLTMLEENPSKQRVIYTDTESDSDNIILTIAVRNVATCEMLIPKSKYDPWQFLTLTEQLGVKNVH